MDDDDDRAPRPRVEDTDEDSSKHQLACWVLRETRFVGSVDEASKRLTLGFYKTTPRLKFRRSDALARSSSLFTARSNCSTRGEAPDGVVDLLDDMRSWLRPEKSEDDEEPMEREHFLAPDSLFGVFVRRSLLEATETHFDGVARTYDRVCEYVRRYQEDDDSGAFYRQGCSRRDLDLFLERRILAAASVCGSVTLEETERECSKIEALEPDLPRSSYLRFVASLYGREYLGALDHLHRYFDYAGSRGGPVSPNDEKGARGVVQYAALNLACLHARFGHARLASCALDEAVRVAQQRHDHACVTFALGWLRYVDIREGI